MKGRSLPAYSALMQIAIDEWKSSGAAWVTMVCVYSEGERCELWKAYADPPSKTSFSHSCQSAGIVTLLLKFCCWKAFIVGFSVFLLFSTGSLSFLLS